MATAIVKCAVCFGLAFMAILAYGCGGSSVTFSLDPNEPQLHSQNIKRDNVEFVRVTDGRAKAGNQIGIVHVGMFNKSVPYIFEGDLAGNVKSMLDTLVVTQGEAAKIIPVQVSIDLFEVGENMNFLSEEGYFACNLRFSYPVTRDSIVSRQIFTKETTGGIDVTGNLEHLIYKGVSDCARSFLTGAFSQSPGLEVSRDSIPLITAMKPTPVASSPNRDSTGTPESAGMAPSIPDAHELSIHYIRGGKVTTGIRGTYSIFSQPAVSDHLVGLGISFTYFDIDNKDDFVKGTFVNFGGRLVGRKFLGQVESSPYIGGGLGFAGGTEKISNGSSQVESFFLGPALEEVIGMSFGRKASVEFGAFQLAYFGSKLLPSDLGLITGFSLAF